MCRCTCARPRLHRRPRLRDPSARMASALIRAQDERNIGRTHPQHPACLPHRPPPVQHPVQYERSSFLFVVQRQSFSHRLTSSLLQYLWHYYCTKALGIGAALTATTERAYPFRLVVEAVAPLPRPPSRLGQASRHRAALRGVRHPPGLVSAGRRGGAGTICHLGRTSGHGRPLRHRRGWPEQPTAVHPAVRQRWSADARPGRRGGLPHQLCA